MTNHSKEMLSYVPDYYKDSKFYREQNNAKGEEFNIIRFLIEDTIKQFKPQTATWGLKLWEELCGFDNQNQDIQNRRNRITTLLSIVSPMTPKTLEKMIYGYTGAKIEVVRNIAPYTFTIKFLEDKEIDYKLLRQQIEDVKETHMSFFYTFAIVVCLNKEIINLDTIKNYMEFYTFNIFEDLEIINFFTFILKENFSNETKLLIDINIKNPINLYRIVNHNIFQLQNYVNYKNIINRFVITNKKFRCFDDEWCFGDNNVFFNDYIDIFKFTSSMSFNDIKLINKNLINLYRMVNHNVFQLQNYIKSKEITNKIVVYTNEHYFNILKILINANIKNPINLNNIINHYVFQLQNCIKSKGITNKIITYINEHYSNLFKILIDVNIKNNITLINNKIITYGINVERSKILTII